MPAMGPNRRCVGQQARHHCWQAQPYPSKAICSCTLPLTYLIDARLHLHTVAGSAHPALTNSQPDAFLLLTHMHTTTTSQVLFKARRLQQKRDSVLHLESKRERNEVSQITETASPTPGSKRGSLHTWHLFLRACGSPSLAPCPVPLQSSLPGKPLPSLCYAKG